MHQYHPAVPGPNILSHACPSYYLNSTKGEVIHNPDDRGWRGRTKYGRGQCPAPPSHLHHPCSFILQTRIWIIVILFICVTNSANSGVALELSTTKLIIFQLPRVQHSDFTGSSLVWVVACCNYFRELCSDLWQLCSDQCQYQWNAIYQDLVTPSGILLVSLHINHTQTSELGCSLALISIDQHNLMLKDH